MRRLEDEAVLALRPWRLELVTVTEAMTLRDFAARYPGPVEIDELARLNRGAPDDTVPAGTRLKRVVGERYR